MAATATVTRITKMADGKWWVEFGAEGNVYNSLDEMKERVLAIQTTETARSLAIAWWLARQPDGTNANLIVGKTLTFDLSAAQPIKVQ